MPATWKNCVPSWPPPGNSSRPVRLSTGQAVRSRAVAAAGGVSGDSLGRPPGLRARIERRRGRTPAPAGHPPGEPGAHASGVVASLPARLTELRRELAETKAQLAAAHGELLALRRHPANAVPGDGCRPPSSTTPR